MFHFAATVNVGKTAPDEPDILPFVCLVAVILNVKNIFVFVYG